MLNHIQSLRQQSFRFGIVNPRPLSRRRRQRNTPPTCLGRREAGVMTGRCGARGALNAGVALAAGGSQRAPAAAGTHRPGVARGRQSTSGLPSDALIELDSGAGWAWGSQSPPLASGRSHHGGPQAGAMRGGAVGSPTWRRMSRMVDGSVMKAMIRISAPQREHTSGNASCIRASSSANAQRAPRRGAGAAAGVVPCGVGATAAHRKVSWRPRTAGFGRAQSMYGSYCSPETGHPAELGDWN